MTDVNRESREQQDEINVKSPSQLKKDESEKQERIDNMFMNLRSAETVCYKLIHNSSYSILIVTGWCLLHG